MPNPKAAPTEREWLFKSNNGQVFGPVPEPRLVELIMSREVVGSTEVAPEGGAWRPVHDVPGFLVHVRKAEVRARVEAEVTGARKLERRRSAFRWSLVVVGAIVLFAVASGLAWYLAIKRPWERRSELLADFGEGITIGTVSVGASTRSAEEEVAVPGERTAPQESKGSAGAVTAPRPHRAAPGPVARSGDLVQAQYDPRRIQAVVGRRQGSLAPCVREEARRSPDFMGVIPLEFAVGNDGRISKLWIDEPRFKNGPFHDCLFATMRSWAFDAFPGQRPVVSLSIRIGPPR